MDADRFDRLVTAFVTGGSRRGLLRLLPALPLFTSLTAHLAEQSQAAKKKNKTKKCARAGQKTSKKRKKCCPGLVKNGKVCTAPACPRGCRPCHTCNAATGQCVPITDGTPCSDGSPCTRPDTCQGGVCIGGPALPNGTPCNDRNACTQAAACQNGVCVGSNPIVCPPPASSACPPATCDPATGQCHFPNGAICGTQSQPGGGATRCCNGACPTPTCLPPGTPITVTDCGACATMGEAQCCSKATTCNLDTNACSCIVGAGFCGSDADCQSETPTCICGSCEAASSP